MNVSELKAEELDTYLELLKELDQENVLSHDEGLQLLEKIKRYPFYKIYYVRKEDEIIGTFSLIIIDNFGHGGKKLAILENVVVNPDYKRMGIGKKLMEKAMDIAAKNDCYKLMLSSSENRKEAHAFYDSLNFKRHGVSFITELIK
ncbi:GNAT family N-acetyltransferase [Pseudalkalibacillus sp. A8]|uniref:GNAT family N-acetyltransferase n=1 Tax=Pseudalkalibacillus sp. A8 TaxID=3382641 RepID=UPI0038B44A33